MARGARLGRLVVLGGCVTALWAALLASDPDAWARAGDVTEPPVVVVEPAFFVGMVEVRGSHERGYGVLLSTATEDVQVADNAVARALMGFEGEVVAVQGRLIESAEAPPTLFVFRFRVLGLEPRGGSASEPVEIEV